MANAHDLQQVLNEMHERTDALREGFGVVESDFGRLETEDGQFKFEELSGYHADVGEVQGYSEDLSKEVDQMLEFQNQHLESDLRQQIAHLTEAIAAAASALHDHANRHQEAHHDLQHEATQFGSDIDHSISELDHTKAQYLQHVDHMTQTLGDAADKASHSAQALGDSVQHEQTETLNKAHESCHGTVSKHNESTIPQLLEQGLSQLGQGADHLDQHCTSTGDMFKQELTQFIKDIEDDAIKEVHDQIEAKFKKLIEEVLKFLADQIAESILMTTAGAATTSAMAEILPEMIALKKALDAIKVAIEAFKALKDLL